MSAAQQPHALGPGRCGCHSGVTQGPEESSFPRMSSCNICGKPLADETVKGGVLLKGIVIPNNHEISENFMLCGAKNAPEGDGKAVPTIKKDTQNNHYAK